MKKYMNFASLLVFVVISIFVVQGTFLNVYAAEDKVIVRLNGSVIEFPDAQPYIDQNDRTLVPIRFVAEAMGTDVKWEENGKTETVTLKRNRKVIDLKIGEYGATVNDVRWALDTCAILKEDRTFVPLRFVSEILGAEVNWNEDTWTVEIKDKTKTDPIATPKPTIKPSPTATITPASTPTPTPIPTQVPTPTSTPSVPVPTGTPSPVNPIPGNPYYVNGISSKEDLNRYERLQGLLKYDDIVGISGDENNMDLGRLQLSYGCWNPYQNRYSGYMSIDFRESSPSFMIRIGKGGEKELQRLREIIDIGILGDQDYKDFIYDTILSCKNGFAGGQVNYNDKTIFINYNTAEYTKDIWGDEAFFVTVFN